MTNDSDFEILLEGNSFKDVSESKSFKACVENPLLSRIFLSSKKASYAIEAYGITDIGLSRPNNEDMWGQFPGLPFFALADGMGGHKAGEVASRMAILLLFRLFKKNFLEKTSSEEWEARFFEIIENVNRMIYKKGHGEENLKGMGTTLCLAFFLENNVILAHVGDSRIYRLRDGALKLMTQDHSLIRSLINKGLLKEEEANTFTYKNIITRALGAENRIEPSLQTESFSIGDVWMLCTDGLSDMLSLQEIEQILKKYPDTKEASQQLVEASKLKGGTDNITVIVIKVVSPHDLSR